MATGAVRGADAAPKTAALSPPVNGQPAPETTTQAPAGRSFVKSWTVDELVPLVNKGLKGKRDFERGKKLFTEAACSACHLFAGDGGGVGPDLTGSGTFSVRDLLESIIEPSKLISSLYVTTVVVKKDGGVVSGRVPEESDTTVSVMEDVQDPAKLTVIKRQDIRTMTPSTVSLMPPGLIYTLNADEISDLLAFLVSGNDSTLRMFQ